LHLVTISSRVVHINAVYQEETVDPGKQVSLLCAHYAIAISVRVHMHVPRGNIHYCNDIQEGINLIANAQKQFDHATGLPQCTGVWLYQVETALLVDRYNSAKVPFQCTLLWSGLKTKCGLCPLITLSTC